VDLIALTWQVNFCTGFRRVLGWRSWRNHSGNESYSEVDANVLEGNGVLDAVGDRWAVLILRDLSVDKGHCLTCFWRLDV